MGREGEKEEHDLRLGTKMEEFEEKLRAEGVFNPIGRSTVSTNLNSSELPEIKPSSMHRLDLSLFYTFSTLLCSEVWPPLSL